MTPTIKLFGTYLDSEMEAVALQVLRSGQIASGHYVAEFGNQLGKLLGNPNVVTVSDVSMAIVIALRLAGCRNGEEVLTTAYACMSTNAPIVMAGGRPVWVDVNPDTGQMDPNALEAAINPRTKIVIVYHVAGYPAPIEKIAAICAEHGITLIEDCDNALLATVNKNQVGSFGDFAVFSFYPNRLINATEGGALVCKYPADAKRAVSLRRYGIDSEKFRDIDGEISPLCDIPEIGWSATLNNLCSAIGLSQLTGVTARIQRTREIAKLLREGLAGSPGVEVVPAQQGADPAYWALLVRIKNRDKVLLRMRAHGVYTSKLHFRTDYYSGFGVPAADLPNTKKFLDTVLALPCGWWMSDADAKVVVNELKNSVISSEI